MSEVATPALDTGRPSVAALAWTQVRYGNRSFWRSPIAAFFTVVFPLIFLVLLSALIGNEVIDAGGDVRLAQFLTPRIAAFAATMASFVSLAISLSLDRDNGVLKRIRGTPLPPWLFLTGRIGSSVWIAFVSVLLMVVVGVAFFGVQIVWSSLPAGLASLAVGIACFAALALVVVALSPTAAATPAITNGTILPLAFISDVFGDSSGLPDWLQTLGWVFPLKHFAHALQAAFNPYESWAAWDHLGVMAAWGVAGLVVALALFRWESPRKGGSQAAPRPTASAGGATRRLRPVEQPGRPGGFALAVGQAGYGISKVFRSTVSVFFVLAFPVILLVLLPVVFGGGGAQLDFRGGIPLVQFLAPVLGVFGAATAAYTDFSERVAADRDEGILKRLHGTPLPAWAYLSGRIAAALAVAFLALAVVVAVGVAFLGVEVVWRAVPGLLVSVVVGIACFATLGLAIAAVAPDARATSAIAQATLLPLSFFSDIFLIGDLPAWMDTVGWIFPLKHFANAVADAFNPTVAGVGLYADHLAVMAAWTVVGAAAALRWWSWEPRSSGRSGRRGRRAAKEG